MSKCWNALRQYDKALEASKAAVECNPDAKEAKSDFCARIRSTGRLGMFEGLVTGGIFRVVEQVARPKGNLKVWLDFKDDAIFKAKKQALIGVKRLMAENGICWVERDADLILVAGKAEDLQTKMRGHAEGSTPFVLMESGAACSSSLILDSPAPRGLRAIFNTFSFRDEQLRQTEGYGGGYHYALMAQLEAYQNAKNLEAARGWECQPATSRPVPLRQVSWDFRSTPLYQFDLYEQVPEGDRPIDVNCMVSLDHTGECPHGFYWTHRVLACRAVEALRTSAGATVRTRHCDRDKYIQTMRSSKLCLSPWGKGEFAFRDYEAILCGALVIKPESSWIESNPDIYREDRMVFCKPDFSDLPEILQNVRQGRLDREAMAHMAASAVREFTLQTWAARLAQDIWQAYDSGR